MKHPNKDFIDKFLGENLNLPIKNLEQKRKQRLDEYYISKQEKTFLNEFLLKKSINRRTRKIKLKNLHLKEEEKNYLNVDLKDDVTKFISNNPPITKEKEIKPLHQEFKEQFDYISERLGCQNNIEISSNHESDSNKWIEKKQKELNERKNNFNKQFIDTIKQSNKILSHSDNLRIKNPSNADLLNIDKDELTSFWCG